MKEIISFLLGESPQGSKKNSFRGQGKTEWLPYAMKFQWWCVVVVVVVVVVVFQKGLLLGNL